MISLDMMPSDQGADPFYAQLTAFTSVTKTLKGFTSAVLGICKIARHLSYSPPIHCYITYCHVVQ
jgi:hypothetical protein